MAICFCTGACRYGRCPAGNNGPGVPPGGPWNPPPQKPLVPMVPAPGREHVPFPTRTVTELVTCQACNGTGKRKENRKTVVCSGCHGAGVHRV